MGFDNLTTKGNLFGSAEAPTTNDFGRWQFVPLIDDQGRLLGIINVIDALVVFFLLVIVVAGIAFVDPLATRETATRYATIDLGPQPDYLVERVTAGDRMELGNSPDNLTITDVYLGPAAEGGTQIAVRARLNGEVTDPDDGPPQFHFSNEPLLVGQKLTIKTVDYTVTGNVTSVDVEDGSLPTSTTSVVASTTVTNAEADRLAVGDAYRVDGQAVAVLKSVQLYPTPNGSGRIALLGLELSTIERGATTRFGPVEVRLGSSIPFDPPTYSLQPEIVELGTTAIPTTETAVVLEATVPTSVVDDVEAGDSYEIGGETIARLDSVAVYPTANRTQKRVVLGATLVTRTDIDRQQFAGRDVRIGTTVPFETSAYQLAGEVIRTGTTAPPGEPTTTSATIRIEDIPPEIADDIELGQTETIRGETLARVVGRDGAPATVILESDDGNIYERAHPRNRDVTLELQLQTRETAGDLWFHGEPILVGDTIVLDLGHLTIQGEITSLEG